MTMDAKNIQQPDEPAGALGFVDIHHISPQQLAMLGIQEIAYVKPMVVNGIAAYAIHAADGTPMAVADNLEVAMAAIVQHDMMPALVH